MTQKLLSITILLALIVLSPRCGRKPDPGENDQKELWKPKKGTTYVGNLPKEIVWLKDGAEMVLVPAGEFLYGENNETRTLDSFYIDKHLVANERYRRFVQDANYKSPYVDEGWAKPFNWKGKKCPKGKAKHPVVLVDWYDAVAFCEWAGKSLPTEEQWEKAARGTDGRRYPWGDEFDEKKCNCYLTGIEEPTPVDRYPSGASPYGCYDMARNVWDWTKSEKEAGYVMRGGSFFEGDVLVRSYSRVWGRPDVKGKNCGFRSCCVPPR